MESRPLSVRSARTPRNGGNIEDASDVRNKELSSAGSQQRSANASVKGASSVTRSIKHRGVNGLESAGVAQSSGRLAERTSHSKKTKPQTIEHRKVGQKERSEPLSSLAYPTPSPLSYDPKLPPSGFQYSILGKHVPSKAEQGSLGPGPSRYNVREIDAIYDERPQWSFGMKLGEYMKVDADGPGPLAYGNPIKTFGKPGQGYKMSGWFSHSIEVTPSPDKYLPTANSIPVAGASPKYSFGSKPSSRYVPTPGPQDYDVHHISSGIAAAPSYTIRPRVGQPVFTNREDELIPGCNKYNPQQEKSAKAASLKGWYKESKSLKTPGPANYILPNSLFSGPQYSLTGRNFPNAAPDSEDTLPDCLPGPANYDPKPIFVESPKCSLGAKQTQFNASNFDFPGPSVYQPKDRQIKFNESPKITLKGRYSAKIELTPGPGEYNVAAPVEHNPTADELANIGKVKKFPPRLKTIIEKIPGPADYNLASASVCAVKRSGPKYSLSKRLPVQKSDVTPGPNVYNATRKMDGPQISMKGRMSPFVLVFPSQRVDTLRLK